MCTVDHPQAVRRLQSQVKQQNYNPRALHWVKHRLRKGARYIDNNVMRIVDHI
jgi:hypothetical protein